MQRKQLTESDRAILMAALGVYSKLLQEKELGEWLRKRATKRVEELGKVLGDAEAIENIGEK